MGNPVVHFEIAGPNGPALQQFYRDLFGWNVQTQGEEMGNYGLVQTNEGGIGGGIMETTEDMPVSNYVTFYIQVDDLRTALDKLSGMGGAAVMPPMETCARHGVPLPRSQTPPATPLVCTPWPAEWDGEMPPEGNAPPVVHFEVGGSDAEALNEFYTEMFGWQTTLMKEMNYRLVKQEPAGIGGGIFLHMDGMPPNAPSVAVMVDDLQAYLDKAVGLGANGPDATQRDSRSLRLARDL